VDRRALTIRKGVAPGTTARFAASGQQTASIRLSVNCKWRQDQREVQAAMQYAGAIVEPAVDQLAWPGAVAR
jgi:hypothetical protein